MDLNWRITSYLQNGPKRCPANQTPAAPRLQVQVFMCIRIFFFTRVDKATFLSNRTLFSRRAWSICPQPHPPHSFGAYSQYCRSHPPCISTALHSLLFRALLVLLFLIPPWSPPPPRPSMQLQFPHNADPRCCRPGQNHKSLLE